MNTTLAYLRGRRAWLVENFPVWGTDAEFEVDLAVCEEINGVKRIGFLPVSIGGHRQEVLFSGLADKRGNSLPENISQPAVVILPRSRGSAYVASVKGETGFVVARGTDGPASVTVDILIFETGL